MDVRTKVSAIRGYQVAAMARACDAIVMGRKGACLALLRAVSLESVRVKASPVQATVERDVAPSAQLQT